VSTNRVTGGTREQLRRLQEQQAQRRHDRKLLVVAALVLVLVVVGGGIGLQMWRTSRSPSAPAGTSSSFAPVTIADGRPIVLGRASAPVKVQLYEDFHCSHCQEFEERLGPTLTAEQDAGRVAVELYPMSFIDSGSAAAANAMACAAESGFGQAYYLGLFANANLQWSDAQLVELAGLVATPVPAGFDRCVTTKAHQPWVDSINTAAGANGVTGTPTLFVQGAKVDTEITAADLKAALDRAVGAR
jgi:protein-disulfide isomerase